MPIQNLSQPIQSQAWQRMVKGALKDLTVCKWSLLSEGSIYDFNFKHTIHIQTVLGPTKLGILNIPLAFAIKTGHYLIQCNHYDFLCVTVLLY